jgi:hypothetical protein
VTIAGRAALAAAAVLLAGPPGYAQQPPDRTRDRGQGVPLSIFGTYIRSKELVVYPFYEYYRDGDYEYEAAELGYGTDITEFRGRFRGHEGLIFLGYGLSDNVAVEFEAAVMSASLEKSPQDFTSLPARLEQSGLGDVEGQIRWRWKNETETRPEWFSYFETVFPFQRSKLLIGTPDWEFKLGTGMIRGLSWGTITVRAAVANSGGSFEPGEYAFEYLRRVSSRLRVFAAIEGSEDEVEGIAEAQVSLTPRIALKLNNAFGLTSKAPDWAPEIGLLISCR